MKSWIFETLEKRLWPPKGGSRENVDIVVGGLIHDSTVQLRIAPVITALKTDISKPYVRRKQENGKRMNTPRPSTVALMMNTTLCTAETSTTLRESVAEVSVGGHEIRGLMDSSSSSNFVSASLVKAAKIKTKPCRAKVKLADTNRNVRCRKQCFLTF
ncbi:hypothetical protein ACOME3_007556 [Neoechinorhynchus agilis]